MSKHTCVDCGYAYEPERGDTIHHIAPGGSFEDLPHNRVGPGCAVGKATFLPLEE